MRARKSSSGKSGAGPSGRNVKVSAARWRVTSPSVTPSPCATTLAGAVDSHALRLRDSLSSNEPSSYPALVGVNSHGQYTFHEFTLLLKSLSSCRHQLRSRFYWKMVAKIVFPACLQPSEAALRGLSFVPKPDWQQYTPHFDRDMSCFLDTVFVLGLLMLCALCALCTHLPGRCSQAAGPAPCGPHWGGSTTHRLRHNPMSPRVGPCRSPSLLPCSQVRCN